MRRDALDVAVVICAYTEQRWDQLLAAVESVRRQSAAPREIIIVIDHNPSLLARVRQHVPDALVVENSESRGLSGARNSGIRVARGDVIAFIDEDAVAQPDWLASLMRGYAEPQVIGVGGAIKPVWQGGRPSWFPSEFDWVVGCTYTGMPTKTAPIRNLIGCNMSFRREVFALGGGFRSGIGRVGSRPVGCEETELCIRTRQRWPQSEFRYDPTACVHHHVPTPRRRWQYFQARCYAEGLSKALVSRFVGVEHGLASERTYTLQTLPRGVARGMRDLLRHGDVYGLLRAGAIVAGLGITTIGYLRGRLAGVPDGSATARAAVIQPVKRL